eukprot:scaffold733_cov267-Pinguiococcus_pyrenoidosus.AAC.2
MTAVADAGAVGRATGSACTCASSGRLSAAYSHPSWAAACERPGRPRAAAPCALSGAQIGVYLRLLSAAFRCLRALRLFGGQALRLALHERLEQQVFLLQLCQQRRLLFSRGLGLFSCHQSGDFAVPGSRLRLAQRLELLGLRGQLRLQTLHSRAGVVCGCGVIVALDVAEDVVQRPKRLSQTLRLRNGRRRRSLRLSAKLGERLVRVQDLVLVAPDDVLELPLMPVLRLGQMPFESADGLCRLLLEPQRVGEESAQRLKSAGVVRAQRALQAPVLHARHGQLLAQLFGIELGGDCSAAADSSALSVFRSAKLASTSPWSAKSSVSPGWTAARPALLLSSSARAAWYSASSCRASFLVLGTSVLSKRPPIRVKVPDALRTVRAFWVVKPDTVHFGVAPLASLGESKDKCELSGASWPSHGLVPAREAGESFEDFICGKGARPLSAQVNKELGAAVCS